MPTTSNALCGQFIMGHCWWGGDLSYLGTASGAPYWWTPSSTFTGATMMWPIACHIHKPLGIVRRGPRCFTGREDWALGRAATREHPGPGEDPGVTPDITPGCQVLGIGANTPAAHHPTRCQDATVGNPYPQVPIPCPSSPQPSTFWPMPSLATRQGDGQGLP